MQPEKAAPETAATDEARRRFLAACGKFALATPPAISLMLAAGERNYATAASGGGGGVQGNHNGNNGFGNGGGDGVPGRSGSNPSPNAGQKSADGVR